MRKHIFKVCILFGIAFLNCRLLHSQIIDFSRDKPYKKVFVDTDNFGPSYLNVLENSYPKATPDSLQFSILNDLAYYWHTRDLVRALELTEKGLKLTLDKKDTLWLGRFQITQGAILLRMEELDKAEKVLEEAKNHVQDIDLPHLNTQLGYVYERRGILDKAADYALESLRLGQLLNDKKAIAMAYSDLSNLFWKQSKFQTGLEYGLKSLKLFEERGINDMDYDFTLFVVGNNYMSLKDYDKALHYFQHSIAIGERYGFYNNLSDTYILLIDLYSDFNEFGKAEEAGTEALKYAELLNNNFMLMRSWLSIGKLQNREGKYGAAIESLKKCITIATENFGDTFFLSQAYENLGKSYAGNHQYKEAYQAFEVYDKFKDAVFTVEADERISKIRTEFDVANKESTIILQETELKKQQSRQNLIMIITALLLLLLLLAYKAIQNKLKINKLLEKQNKEKEFLLKEIHHRVKNNLETVSSLLALQASQIKDQNILDAMEASQHRVHSMGMIHQKLYTGENLAAIEMKDYFLNLADYIRDAFGMQEQVEIKVMMTELELDVDMAIPIGLIVNELLTNALKYAFPDNRKGHIHIALKENGTLLQLDVSDNGIGYKTEKKARGTGFGANLIELLTKQLDGKMVLKVNQGTSIQIKFQLNSAA